MSAKKPQRVRFHSMRPEFEFGTDHPDHSDITILVWNTATKAEARKRLKEFLVDVHCNGARMLPEGGAE